RAGFSIRKTSGCGGAPSNSRAIWKRSPGNAAKPMFSTAICACAAPAPSPASSRSAASAAFVALTPLMSLLPRFSLFAMPVPSFRQGSGGRRAGLPQHHGLRTLDPAAVAARHDFHHVHLEGRYVHDAAVVAPEIVAHRHAVNAAVAVADQGPGGAVALQAAHHGERG